MDQILDQPHLKSITRRKESVEFCFYVQMAMRRGGTLCVRFLILGNLSCKVPSSVDAKILLMVLCALHTLENNYWLKSCKAFFFFKHTID